MNKHPYRINCCKCKELIFNGYEDDVYMDIYGDYIPGAGRCKECGKDFCYECGEIENDLCITCREKLEKEEQEEGKDYEED